MKSTKLTGWLLAGLTACFGMASCSEENVSPEEPVVAVEDGSIIPGQYIVVFKDETSPGSRIGEPSFTNRQEKKAYAAERRRAVNSQIDRVITESNVKESHVSARYSAVMTGFAASLSEDELASLNANPAVAYIEPDRVVTLDYTVEAQYTAEEYAIASDATGRSSQTTTCAVSNAGGPASGSGSNKFIWIVDTGIDLDHPDLNVNTQYGRAFVDGSPDDGNGHGTHVAGIAGAISNTIGVVGVSAGAPVVPVDVFGSSGSTSTSIIISGMDYVAQNDITGDVVNMSLGPRFRTGCSSTSAYRGALDRLNNQSLIAIASGNSGDDAAYYDPACQNLPNVFTVASMTCNKGWSSFSNYGTPVDYIATGSSVTSTYPGGGYATISGTSMASPVIAGVLHQRGSAPRACGTVSYGGRSYTIGCR